MVAGCNQATNHETEESPLLYTCRVSDSGSGGVVAAAVIIMYIVKWYYVHEGCTIHGLVLMKIAESCNDF